MGMHQKLPPDGVSRLPQPKTKPPAEKSEQHKGLENLLLLEAEVRKCNNLKQLQFLIANETVKLIPASQTLIMTGSGNLKITAVSSLASLDKTSPTLRWLEKSLTNLIAKTENQPVGASSENHVSTGILDGAGAPESPWPFCHILLARLPLQKNRAEATIAFLNTTGFTIANRATADRLAQTYAHAWDALSKTGVSFARLLTKKFAICAALICIGALFIPVTMTVLAPVEIVARSPQIVAAPLNGVVEQIKVVPNEYVKTGQLLFTYNSTDFDNESTIAGQNVEVAKSRYRRASQDAFNTGNGRREMAELKAELDLATAKLNYAQSRLELSRVRATRDGVILFSDRDDWIGKPVTTGEKVMKIADPRQTEYLIALALGDSIVLDGANSARIFLDTDPLNPVMANITRRSYHAKSDQMNDMSYELFAQSKPEEGHDQSINHRIGIRGTAQIFGNKTSLGMFLFRKPLSAFRQYTGF